METKFSKKRLAVVLEKLLRKKITRLLDESKLQEILDLVVGGAKLTKDEAERFILVLTSIGNHTMTVTSSVGTEESFYVNIPALKDIIEILTSGGMVELKEDEFGSEAVHTAIVEGIEKIVLSKVEAGKKVFKNKDGGFFDYINTSDISLKRYQIFTQKEAERYSFPEHCILHTLRQCGVSETDINSIKLRTIQGSNLRKSALSLVASIIKRDIWLRHITADGREKITKFKQKENRKGPKVELSDDYIELAIHLHHFFIYEKTEHYSYAIKNYSRHRDVPNRETITQERITNGKTYYVRNTNKSAKISSLKLIVELEKQGIFKKQNLEMFAEAKRVKEVTDIIYLDSIDKEQHQVGLDEKGKKIPNQVKHTNIQPTDWTKSEENVWFADTETLVNGKYHELYLIGMVRIGETKVKIMNSCDRTPKAIVNNMLKLITDDGQKDGKCYFHNLKYDHGVLAQYLYHRGICEKDKRLYSVKVMYRKKSVTFMDSLKMINMPLSKFGKEFGLPSEICKKDAIAYDYYTRENHNKRIEMSEYRKLLSFEEQVTFDGYMKTEDSVNWTDNTFNPYEYYIKYLKMDCLVLMHGMLKFADDIRTITGGISSVFNSLTISSLMDKYLRDIGVYEDVFEISGNLRDYVNRAVRGGRVWANPKYSGKIIEQPLSDCDGNSLYPSAEVRLSNETGLPIGEAKRLTDVTQWTKYTFAVMTVRITKVNKVQQLPFIAHSVDGTSIDYSNEAPSGLIVIDSFGLGDLIKFHKIEYEVLDGVYWDNGGNRKVGAVLTEMYNERMQYRKDGKEALANVIKLMLNSAYGKTVEKKSETHFTVWHTDDLYDEDDANITRKMTNKEKYLSYRSNNFNTIKGERSLSDTCVAIETMQVDRSFNRAHIGCAVLSMSRRIMNEVCDVANSLERPILYTDTDSLHICQEGLPSVISKYKEIYGREMMGDDLGQFKSDFKLMETDTEIDGTRKKIENVVSVKSCFLGKKTYLDVLAGCDRAGRLTYGIHVRMKGITEEGINHMAKTFSPDGKTTNFLSMFKHLSEGKPLNMLMNPMNIDTNKKKAMFEYDRKTCNVGTVQREFYRNVQFNKSKDN